MNDVVEYGDLPQSVEAEQAFLGSVIKLNKQMAEVLDFLNPEAFYLERHQMIFEAMLELEEEGMPFDELIVADRLKEKRKLDEAGGYLYLTELKDYAPVSVNASHYARIIHERYLTREVIRISGELTRKGRDPSSDLGELLNEAESRLSEIALRKKTESYSHLYDVSKALFKTLEEKNKSSDPVTGLRTGYGDIDRKTAGLQNSDLIVVAARPSMGKTSFALNLVSNIGIRNQKPCLLFSLEMSKEQIAQRVLCSEAMIDTELMRNGNLSQDDWDRIGTTMEKLAKSPIYVNDTPGIKTVELKAIAKQVNESLEEGLALIVVDYLQLISSVASVQNREQAISDISRTLKGLAKELNVPVIALSQLNRSLESRGDRRPIMSDLRESGSIEQDADIVMFLYRDSVYNKDTEDKALTELNFAKHRNGSTGVVQLRFIGKHTTFHAVARETESEDFFEQPSG